MSEYELSRPVDVRQSDGKTDRIVANEAERAALASRFGLVSVDRLEAEVLLSRKDRTVTASGRLSADIVQSCAVSAEDLPVTIDEELSFRFVPERGDHGGEVELDAQDCDEIEYAGTSFDLGEAVAQSLGLAIDPYATGPQADEARREAGLLNPEDTGPFAALKGLSLKE